MEARWHILFFESTKRSPSRRSEGRRGKKNLSDEFNERFGRNARSVKGVPPLIGIMKGLYPAPVLREQKRRGNRPTLTKRLLKSRAKNGVDFPDQERIGMHRHLDEGDTIDRLIDLRYFSGKSGLSDLSEAIDRHMRAICPKDS